MRSVVCACALLAALGAYIEPGPAHPPSQGEVWPKPQREDKEDTFYTFNPSQFTVEITGHNCSMLAAAVERYVYVLRQLHALARRGRRRGRAAPPPPPPPAYAGALRRLALQLDRPCEPAPHLHMDEAYSLTVGENATLSAAAVWGALRGLETFAQLFYLSDDYTDVRINATAISDWPRYPHRGLMLDTARHYLPRAALLATLDAMVANKMNVLHWHLVDDQSFPYQSDRFPDLSLRGAYHPSMVYTREDIATVVEYATARGVRVVPEIDVPGHTRSWGAAFPELLTQCYSSSGEEAGLGPLQPLRARTYAVLRALLQEVRQRFPDTHLHVGGDEVDLSCWNSNPELQQYMREHNMSDPSQLHALFMRDTLPLLPADTTPIVWQEVFDEGVPLPNDTLVHVWKGAAWDMVKALRAGHKVLFSSYWYLDHLGDTFETFLSVDPRGMVEAAADAALAAGVLGGEACMWGELVDDTNLLPRVWPRASAVAERLWSAALPGAGRGGGGGGGGGGGRGGRRAPEEALRRAAEHVCRMRRRGIPAAPAAGPGYCVL
ncbi:beta-hexosaminidase subunit beta-like [Pectinophora gossypiella]|uniref:beta-hexosaminidase subunit beta-like n=1 Tax=Pectinophora gossypiella TaxID=13191 RepID=UPI00214E28CC|nr:beta-hexosaminidase subunit beta-like [Pectinophora gossypiella]